MKIVQMLPQKACWEMLGIRRTNFYRGIKEGLIPQPVAVASGRRMKALPAHELNAINAARLAGKSDEEIRELVKRLEASRSNQELWAVWRSE